MSLFKTREEKEIIAKMEREEQLQAFNEQIAELKGKQKEYAKIAAEAEVNGDNSSYELAVNALIELNEFISALIQTKTNFDVINISNSISMSMATAMNALSKLTDNKVKLPNIRQIQNTQLKMQKYMREVTVSQKAMGMAMKRSNPANKIRTEEEIMAVRSLIDSERAKITSAPNMSTVKNNKVESPLSLADEIEKEQNKLD